MLYTGFGGIDIADLVLIVLYTGLDWICWGTIYWFVVSGNVWVVIGTVVVVETGKKLFLTTLVVTGTWTGWETGIVIDWEIGTGG